MYISLVAVRLEDVPNRRMTLMAEIIQSKNIAYVYIKELTQFRSKDGNDMLKKVESQDETVNINKETGIKKNCQTQMHIANTIFTT